MDYHFAAENFDRLYIMIYARATRMTYAHSSSILMNFCIESINFAINICFFL